MIFLPSLGSLHFIQFACRLRSASRLEADDQSLAGSGWKAATPLGPSDKAPLRSGPMHCPVPNAMVSAAIAAVQACGFAAFLANEVTAAMTARTDPPKRMEER